MGLVHVFECGDGLQMVRFMDEQWLCNVNVRDVREICDLCYYTAKSASPRDPKLTTKLLISDSRPVFWQHVKL